MKRRHVPIPASRPDAHQHRAVCRDPYRGGPSTTMMVRTAWLYRLARDGTMPPGKATLQKNATDPITGKVYSAKRDREAYNLYEYGRKEGPRTTRTHKRQFDSWGRPVKDATRDTLGRPVRRVV